MIFYLYRGRGWQHLGTKFWYQQEHLVTSVICCQFQKNLFEVWFYTFFFHDFIHVYSLGAWADSPQGAKVWLSTEMSCHFLHSLQVSKKCLWSLILYSFFFFFFFFFYDLIHVHNPGAGADSAQGTKFWNFDVSRKALSLYPFAARFEVWFYTFSSFFLFFFFFFHDLIHVYSPGAGGIQPQGDKVLMSTETSRHSGHLLLVSNGRRQ